MEQAPAADGVRARPASDSERLEEAKRRVAALKGFYIHLAVFVAVILGLLVVNIATGSPWWALWVFVGWGLGVLAHGLAVSQRLSRRIAEWERRKIREFMDER